MSLTRGKSLALLIAVSAVAFAAPAAMARGGGSGGGGFGASAGAGPNGGGFGAGGRADFQAGPSAADPDNRPGSNKDGALRGLDRADEAAGAHGDIGRDRAETNPGALHRGPK